MKKFRKLFQSDAEMIILLISVALFVCVFIWKSIQFGFFD